MVALALAMALSGLFFFEPDFVPTIVTLDVGHGPVRTLFLSLIFCLVPMTPCETMLYWPHTNALVGYNGGTSVGHGPVTTPFLRLILCLVPMAPCETMLCWPSPNKLVATQSTMCFVDSASHC